MHQRLIPLLFILMSSLFSPLLAQQSDVERAQVQQWASWVDSLQEATDRSHYKRSRYWHSKLDSAVGPSFPDSIKMNYFNESGAYFFNIRLIKDAKAYYKKGEQLAQKLKDTAEMVEAGGGYANALSVSGDYLESLKKYRGVLDLLRAQEDLTSYNGVLLNMAFSHKALSQYDSALAKMKQATFYFDSTGNNQYLGVVLNNMGELYRENLENPRQAIQHYRKSLHNYRKADYKHGIAQVYHNLSITYLDSGALDSALHYCQASLGLLQEMGASGSMAPNYYALGKIYREKGLYPQAEENFQRALDLATKNQMAEGIYYSYNGLSELYRDWGKPEAQEKSLEKALKAAQKLEKLDLLRETYDRLYRFQLRRQDSTEALEYLQEYLKINDSLQKATSSEELQRLRAEYESVITQAENKALREKQNLQEEVIQNQRLLLIVALIAGVLLLLLLLFLVRLAGQRKRALEKYEESQNELAGQLRVIRKQKEELDETNRLKDQILSVLAHDLRSPLTSISGLLATLSAEEITREELQKMTGYLKNEIDVSLRTLQDILQWARLQMSDQPQEPQKIHLESKLKEILEVYEANIRAKEILTNVHVHALPYLLLNPVQLQSMVGNLLSNAIKFSPSKGRIWIYSGQREGQPFLAIRDQGKGMSESVIQKLEANGRIGSQEGTLGEQGTGIGLRIVQDFIQSVGGKLRFENHPEGGAIAQLFFPPEVIPDSSRSQQHSNHGE